MFIDGLSAVYIGSTHVSVVVNENDQKFVDFGWRNAHIVSKKTVVSPISAGMKFSIISCLEMTLKKCE